MFGGQEELYTAAMSSLFSSLDKKVSEHQHIIRLYGQYFDTPCDRKQNFLIVCHLQAVMYDLCITFSKAVKELLT